ncbi:low temperature requirement protein A [Pedobacter sp. P351]|uniref:low temperature requirement protein A n=1 Tax=Pedobacter superstes TaxID=3133441 RepID=UPI0030AD7B4D
MHLKSFSNVWWGPPKKFETEQRQRRVSWLELLYDLVYVIAISKITHHFAENISLGGFLEFACLFIMIYWGWLNGSLHHDLHGNQGLRTRLITLWQIMIIAALAIVLDRSEHHYYTGIIIVLMVMQALITYLWWSVGFYDKNHRKYSWPYTTFYIISIVMMALSLVFQQAWFWFLLPMIFLFNYSPPFVSHILLKQSSQRLDLSSSMFERLGLFTIIIFGELMLGVIDGISEVSVLNFSVWLNFALAVGLVFGLWWIFFTMIARREAKKNFARASLLELLYIPALVALSFIAAGFPSFFHAAESHTVQHLFAYGITVFLICISLMIGLLEFPQEFNEIIKRMQLSIFITGIVFLPLSFINLQLSSTGFLITTIVLLNLEIIYLNFVYYRQLDRKGLQPSDE